VTLLCILVHPTSQASVCHNLGHGSNGCHARVDDKEAARLCCSLDHGMEMEFFCDGELGFVTDIEFDTLGNDHEVEIWRGWARQIVTALSLFFLLEARQFRSACLSQRKDRLH
jgi:hypothetical protein